MAFSGGKDSITIKRLADLAEVKYDAHYSVTTIDPPELIYFIRKYHSDVHWIRPEIPFLRKLSTKGFPLRNRRWCCEFYKENGGNGRTVVTGVRAAESYNRSRRKIIEHCYSGGYKNKNKIFFNPILDWLDDDVWQFIREQKLPYCQLYDEGFKRIGCIFCPMSRRARKIEVTRYPNYVKAFIKAFDALHATGRESVMKWKSGEEMFWWWMDADASSPTDDQYLMKFE